MKKILLKLISGLVSLLKSIKYCKSSCCESECITKSQRSSPDILHQENGISRTKL